MTQTISGVVVHSILGGDLPSGDRKTDGAGWGFDAQISMPFPNTNTPPIDIFVIPPGGPFPAEPTYRWTPVLKSVAIGIDHSGSTLIIWAKTHQTGITGIRQLNTEYAYIPNAWHVTAADIQEEGGEGAFLPTEGGGGGGVPVDYDQIELRIRKVLGVQETVGGETLAHRISGINGDFRQGLEDKAKSAAIELLAPKFLDDGSPNPEWRSDAGVYQDRVFSFNKNAAANPIANVLEGQDEWGQNLQEKLTEIIKAAVQSVLDNEPPPPPTPKAE